MNDKSVQFDDNVVIITYKSNERIVKKSLLKKILKRLSKLWKNK